MRVTQLQPTRMLARFGPESTSPAPTREEALEYVRALAHSHYENFSVLSRLVPERMRDDFAAVYAFCRWSDDLGDEIGSTPEAREKSLELLGWWRRELEACFAFVGGNEDRAPTHPVFVALAETVRRRGLPIGPFDDLIKAFEQDQRVTRYKTWAALLDYCSRSANPVGRLVLGIGGYGGSNAGDEELLRMSDATCTALQLTNHWQDVRRDLIERDRIYMPLEEAGIPEDRLLKWASMPEEPLARVPYIRAMRPLVLRTRELFKEGRPLPRALGNELAPVVWLFGAGGEAVLTRIERMGCATLWQRPRLSKLDKLALIMAASVRFAGRRRVRSRAA